MPNWCQNNLYIKGSPENLRDFVAKVTNTPEKENGRKYDILQNLLPIPQELTDTVSGWSADEDVQTEREKQYEANKAKYGYKDWYDWQYANWGTKWGDHETFLADEGFAHGQIEFAFDTAWGPPIEGIAKISVLFPELSFGLAYVEQGMDFFGVTTFIDGEPIDVCEQISDVDGIVDVDWDSEDYIHQVEANDDRLLHAREFMLIEAGF